MNFEANVDNGGLKPVLLNYGGAKKFVAEMNEQELEAARQSTLRRAKEKAFSKGLPVYYVLNGNVVAEYVDGKILPAEK